MKKFLLMTSFLLLFSFNSVCFAYEYNGEVVPATSKRGDTFYGVETVESILTELSISYDDTSKVAYTYFLNETLKYYQELLSDSTISSLNFLFVKKDSLLYMIPSNGTFSDTLNYSFVYLEGNFYIKYIKTDTTPEAGSFPQNESTYFTSISSSGIRQQAISTVYFGENIPYTITENNLYIDTLVSPASTFSAFAGKPYQFYNLVHTFEFSDVEEIPSGDTSVSGDSGNVDLSGIQSGINNINNNLNNIENKIPTSGDITQSTQTGIVSGNTEFWGSSGDLSGDDQEELISGKIDELTNTLSGDLAENEIFGILQTYEDKLFGGFTGEEDFVISWNDINYNSQKLIPAGEVNFSKICRENEALGNIKSTINIILTFIIMMNIVIYMYNLLLATLGIDNPYLYEKPVGSVTTAEYTDESGRTYVTRTQHDGRGNSISKRYNHTVEPKKRQIGFRKW